MASRWSRLGASLIDGVIGGVLSLPLLSFFDVWEQIDENGNLPFSTAITITLIGIIFFLLINGYLLSKYGQTVGKKLLDIKIVDLNGDIPDFNSLIAKRYVPIWVVSQIPVIGGFIAIIDALFIFRKDKRCVHDLIAGTRVVENTSINFNEKSDSNPF
ncbi:MAG: RDD family protein [Cocleimonas sp.]